MRKKLAVSYEYKTTWGELYPHPVWDRNFEAAAPVKPDVPPSDPTTPSGARWVMCGATASTQKLYWFWRRPKKVRR